MGGLAPARKQEAEKPKTRIRPSVPNLFAEIRRTEKKLMIYGAAGHTGRMVREHAKAAAIFRRLCVPW
jgi:hypothetical protein